MTITPLSTAFSDGSVYTASNVNTTNAAVNVLSASQSLIAAKGDILTGASDDTLGKTTVGANNTILTADSTQTNGVNWSATFAGNSATATALQNTRTIGGVSFDGTANINLAGVNTTGNQNTSGSSASCTGNSATATALQNARTIGGVSFDGTANINLAGVNTTGNQNTSGSSASVTIPSIGTVSAGTYPDLDMYVGSIYSLSNTNLMYNNTTRIELNGGGTDVIGTLGVSGDITGAYGITVRSGEFVATDTLQQFYSDTTYTDLGKGAASLRNSTTVRTETVTGLAVYVSSTGVIGVLSSSRRFKENIVDYDDQESRLLTVSPVTFDYKDGALDERENRFNHFGLIAEDLHDAGLTHLVSYDDEGPKGVDYTMLSVELLGIVKKQQTAIDDLLARVQALETN